MKNPRFNPWLWPEWLLWVLLCVVVSVVACLLLKINP
jgi:hypothetical protein